MLTKTLVHIILPHERCGSCMAEWSNLFSMICNKYQAFHMVKDLKVYRVRRNAINFQTYFQ